MMRNLYSDERNIALAQASGSYCIQCLWAKLLIVCLSSSLQPAHIASAFIYFYIILPSFLLIYRQLSCCFQHNISFLSNQCSVSNILFLPAVPPPSHVANFMYAFFYFLPKNM